MKHPFTRGEWCFLIASVFILLQTIDWYALYRIAHAQTNLPPGAIRMVLHGDHCALLINDKSDRVIYVDVEAKKPVVVTEKANPVIRDGMVSWNGGWVKEIASADGKGLWTGELLPKDKPKTKLDLVGR